MTKFLVVSCRLLAIASVVLLAACGSKKAETGQAPSEPKIVDAKVDAGGGSMKIQSQDGKEKTTIEVKDGQTTVKTEGSDGTTLTQASEDGEKIVSKLPNGTVTTLTGKSAVLPETFPKDVPMYGKAKLISVQAVTGEDESFNVQAETADGLDATSAFYKKEMASNNWKEQSVISEPDKSVMILSEKEGRQAMLSVMREDDKTVIILSVSKKD